MSKVCPDSRVVPHDQVPMVVDGLLSLDQWFEIEAYREDEVRFWVKRYAPLMLCNWTVAEYIDFWLEEGFDECFTRVTV